MHQIERLLKGFEQFQHRYFNADTALFDTLKTGQRPSTLLIGCSDSRVDPGLLLGYEPGELFTVRNIANLVPPYGPADSGGLHGVSAAIQFAVERLCVERVIVMGHAGCGGIRALMSPCGAEEGQDDFIGPWVSIARGARDQVNLALAGAELSHRLRACEQAAILVSLHNLETFPWVAHALQQGRLTLHGWYFDLEEGALLAYSRRLDSFLPLVCPLSVDRPASRDT